MAAFHEPNRRRASALALLPALLGLVACGAVEPAGSGAPGLPAGQPTTASQLQEAQLVAAPKPRPSPIPPEPLDGSSTPLATPAATPAVPPAMPATTPAAQEGQWQTYRSEQAGFTVEYPAGWTASEQVVGGQISVSFAPAGGLGAVMVVVQPGGVAPPESDMPNVRCEQVTAGGLPGTRCFDTIARSTVTVLSGPNTTYTISSLGKTSDGSIYQHMLDTFALLT